MEEPDLGPLRALAEGAELADPAAGVAGAYGRPLAADDPLGPLGADVARVLTEAGFTLHHCDRGHPLCRLGQARLPPSSPDELRVADPTTRTGRLQTER
jgi:hypothetical protein